MKLSLEAIATAANGSIVQGDPGLQVSGFTNDSRGAAPGACFVAIVAERDGHDFVDAAFAAGCGAALLQRATTTAFTDRGIVVVEDTIAALAAIAAAVRVQQFADRTVVGITGSTGKTSTKDLALAALRTRAVHANEQSFNNEIGLPLTILGADESTEVLIAEMGARFAGNIAELCAIARPTIGIVTNIGLAHAEHLGGVDGVLRVKGELIEALPSDGCAIVPAGAIGEQLGSRGSAPFVRVGDPATGPVDVAVTVLELDDSLRPLIRIVSPWGEVETRVGLRGAHQAVNAAMAIVAAYHCGVDLTTAASGIATAEGSHWRMEITRTADDITIINDAYNANPTSVRAAVDALAATATPGNRVAVLGEMRELGAVAEVEHVRVGEQLVAAGIDALICVGDAGAWIANGARGLTTVEAVPDAREAHSVLESLVKPGDVVLVKASRAVGLETVAAGLLERHGRQS